MSMKENDAWVEAAHENFDIALASGNLALCKDIIADTQEAGFPGEARLMNETLRNTPISKLSVKSPIQL